VAILDAQAGEGIAAIDPQSDAVHGACALVGT
jgi:hypothetical protein